MKKQLCRSIIAFILTTIVFSNFASAEERYMAIFMDGNKIGHSVHSRAESEGKVVTVENMTLTINRMGFAITINQKAEYIETKDGKPIAFSNSIKTSGLETVTKGKIVNGMLEAETQMAGNIQKRSIAWPKGALLPEAQRLLSIEKGLKPGTEYEILTFIPDNLSAVSMKVRVKEEKEVDLLGRIKKLHEIETVMNIGTGQMTSTMYVDENYDTYKMIMPLMGIQLEMVDCDKSFATSPNSTADFLSKLFIKSPKVLDLEKSKTLTYTLKVDPSANVIIPNSDNQSVKVLNEATQVVTVKPVTVGFAGNLPYTGKDSEAIEALKPGQYVQSDNALIKELKRQAIGDEKNTIKAARKIEAFVHDYIDRKTLSVGYASALEVAKSKKGDCTEHAVLTAALCKAAGIPARVAVGIVYADSFVGNKNIFGGHAWTEAYIGGKWIGLDATRGVNGFSAGHIKLATGDGEPINFFEMINNLGYFTIAEIK